MSGQGAGGAVPGHDGDPALLRERLKRRLAAFEPTVHAQAGASTEGIPAAVAVTVVIDAAGAPAVLLTVRAGHLRAHSGQFALPGGRVEPGETPVDAARRELEEELGLSLGADATLGLLDDFTSRSGYVITPAVLWAGPIATLAPDPSEVATVHEVAFAELDRPDAPRFRSTADPDRPLIEYPLLGTHVYAPTAAILYQFREVALRGQPVRVAHLEQPRFAWG